MLGNPGRTQICLNILSARVIVMHNHVGFDWSFENFHSSFYFPNISHNKDNLSLKIAIYIYLKIQSGVVTHIYNPGTSEAEAGWSPWCEDSLGSHSKLLDSLDQSKTARKDGDHSSKIHGSSLLLCMSTRLFSVFLQSHVQYNWCSDISQRHRREKTS